MGMAVVTHNDRLAVFLHLLLGQYENRLGRM